MKIDGGFFLKIVAVLGHKKSGKTRLTTMLISSLREMGFSVASAKHVHHADFSIDQVGKDSWRHGEAGANPNVIISPSEIAVIWRNKTLTSPHELSSLVGEVDFLVLEGFYSLVKEYGDILKIVLVGSGDNVPVPGGAIKASFEDVNDPDTLKLPEQYSELLEMVIGDKHRSASQRFIRDSGPK